MSHDLPKAYDPSAIEERWAEYWVRERLFDVETPAPGEASKPFTLLLPPPNVTGRLHMGHMLNQTEMDILTRWHRMSGDTAVWVPGTDHAGIATQMMVERQLAAEGTSRKVLGREAFVDRVWQWKGVYGGAILDQMKRLGASVDWSREYFTMDDRLSPAVKEAFVRLYEQGLIYRGAYIVNWDPQLQTAVSDLEVETEERLGKLYHIRYPLPGPWAAYDETNSIVIATTRPETMLGDAAVAVNPNDERYRHLVGAMLQLPLTSRQIPLIADDWAKPEFGTGAVKVTPAHDPNDFAIGQRHNLPNLNIMDKTGHIDLPGSPFHGKDRFEARALIVAQLDSIGLLVKVEDHPMTVPISQRSGTLIEPRLSDQWFLAVNKAPIGGGQSIAAKAIAAVRDGHIAFTPSMYEKVYAEWMDNLHDWCLSRQLWWGHRIPAYYCDNCKEVVVARSKPSFCKKCTYEGFTQEIDVLDTWFSSGLLPFTVFGWPGEQGKEISSQNKEGSAFPLSSASLLSSSLSPDLAAFYPTDLLVTGFDILFFWVARMIMLGTHFMLDVPLPDGSPRTLADAVPFKAVYIHALVRDADRQKMSKTKGNVIDPIDIIGRFGTDAVRFTLASMASPGTDIAFSEARTEGNRAFANKIWNAARFLFMNIDRAAEAGITVDLTSLSAALHPGAPSSPTASSSAKVGEPIPPLESRWILSKLHATTAAVDRSLADFRFDEAASAVYQFFWGDLCDWYLEIVKLRLNFDEGADLTASKAALTTLVAVFEAALRLLSPFMPFITEEIWHALHTQAAPAKSIALTRFPQAAEIASDPTSVVAMEILQQLIATIRGLRKEMAVPEKEAAPIVLFASKPILALARDSTQILARLARVSSVDFVATPLTGDNARSTPDFDVAVLYARTIDIPAERERLTKDLAKYEKGLAAANRQLSNDAFTAKAPPHIIEGLRKQAAETQLLYDKAKAALDALPHQ